MISPSKCVLAGLALSISCIPFGTTAASPPAKQSVSNYERLWDAPEVPPGIQLPLPVNFLAPFQSYPTSSVPLAVAAVDLNHDSFPDLVVAGSGAKLISIHLGVGDGTFLPRRDVATAAPPSFVTSGDVNLDGHQDIVATEPRDSVVAVFLGLGDGTFAPESRIPVGPKDGQVAIGDFNDDGRPDLVTANGSGSASILLGNGDGTFQPRIDLPTGGQPSWVAVADVNGDGAPDLLIADLGSSAKSVWLGRGDGTFQPVQDPRSHIHGNAIATGDFNRDGKLDVAAGRDSLFVYPGDGEGVFGSRIYVDATPFVDYVTIVAADFNDDGILDLCGSIPLPLGADRLLVPPSFTFPLYMGRGDGTFGPRQDLYTEAEPWFVTVGDFNRDQRLDLVTVSAIASSVSVLPGRGNGTFGTDMLYPTGGHPWYMDSADFNRDGHIDLVTANKDGNTVSVFLGRGDGTLNPKIDYPETDADFVIAADFNSDGNPDLVVGAAPDYFTGSVDVLLGRGDGRFVPLSQGPISRARVIWMAAGDLNRDGNLDLVVVDFYSVRVLLGRGDGSFLPETIAASGSGIVSVAVADVTGDGILDVSFPEFEEDKIAILPGHGDGTFASKVEISDPGRPWSVRVVDLNNDGKPDFLVGGLRLSIILGNGDGTFEAASLLPTGWFPADALAGDIDGDQIPDIVAANFESNTLTVLKGHGDGTFEPRTTLGARGIPESIVIGDLDEDGQRDIALANLRTGISILLNRTGPPMPLHARAFLQGGPRTIALAKTASQTCILLELSGPYDISQVDLSTIRLKSAGTGNISEIAPIKAKSVKLVDTDGNGVAELPVCFARADLSKLFSLILGRHTVEVTLEGSLISGRAFRAPLTLTIVGTRSHGRDIAVRVSPSPLNPRGTLHFGMSVPGPVTARLFDVSGRLVRTLVGAMQLQPGEHDLTIDGKDDRGNTLGTGVYFFRLETPDGMNQGRVVVAK